RRTAERGTRTCGPPEAATHPPGGGCGGSQEAYLLSMKITDLRVHAVRGRHWPRFPMVFVEVETDATGGLVGLGESLLYRSSGVIESLHQVRDYLVGQDPFRIELHWETLYRRGVNPAALSGVEVALWDIVGQACGQPLYNLLGGRCRDRV